jgi:putative transposase
MGISEATFYRWKQLYGGLMLPEVKKLPQLEEENTRLRRLVADLTLDKEMLQEVIRAWPNSAMIGAIRIDPTR